MIYRMIGMTETDAQQEIIRGVYFSSLYKNTSEYLRKEISEDELVEDERVGKGIDYINEWWKPKAKKRFSKLYSEKRLQNDTLWYDDFNMQEKQFKNWLSVRGVKYYE